MDRIAELYVSGDEDLGHCRHRGNLFVDEQGRVTKKNKISKELNKVSGMGQSYF